MKIQFMVFWVLTLPSVVVRYQHFGGPCCLHPHPKDWNFHGNEDSSCGLLGEDCCGNVLQNIGILPYHDTVSKHTKPQLELGQLCFKSFSCNLSSTFL